MSPATAIDLYPVRSYEIDPRGRLRVPELCNYLQESASLHARALGVSIDALRAEGMTWFLWRLHLRMERWPAWGETVSVETWPAEMGRPYAIRDFRLGDAGSREIGVATSAWLLMDLVRERPIRRVPDRIRDLHPDPPERALEDRFRRLPPCESPSLAVVFPVRRGDLDLNGHLNHVAAIEGILEAAPAAADDGLEIEALEIEFKSEGRRGEELTSTSAAEPGGPVFTLRHSLRRPSGGAELARARSRWRTSP